MSDFWDLPGACSCVVAGCGRKGQWPRCLQEEITLLHDIPCSGKMALMTAPLPHFIPTWKSLQNLQHLLFYLKPHPPWVVFISMPVSELFSCLSSFLGAFISLLEMPRLLAMKGSAGSVTCVSSNPYTESFTFRPFSLPPLVRLR